MTNSNLPISKKFFDKTISISIKYTPQWNLEAPQRLKEAKHIRFTSERMKEYVIIKKNDKNFINRIYNYITS